MIPYIAILLFNQCNAIHTINTNKLGFISPPVHNAANPLKNQELNNYSDFDNAENTNRDYSTYNQSRFPKRSGLFKNKYVNNVTLLGNIGTQLKFFEHANGKVSASFFLATLESWKDALTREYKSKNYWHNVIIFSDHIIRNIKDIFKVGDRTYVSGTLKYTLYEDSQGKKYKNHYISIDNFDGNVILLGRSNLRPPNHSGIYDKVNSDYNDSNNFNDLSLDTEESGEFDQESNDFDQDEDETLENHEEEFDQESNEFDQESNEDVE